MHILAVDDDEPIRELLASYLAGEGYRVTTAHDTASAKQALDGDPVDLVVCDLHGNSPAEWQRYDEPLRNRVAPGGSMIISNATLSDIPEWHEETGVRWFLDSLPPGWTFQLDTSTVPGLAVVRRP